MLNQFSRTELLFGHEAMEKLYNARVAVFGVGGVGGYTVEALARSGIGTLDLIDDDKVCLTNINRQVLATRKTVGKYKVEVARDRILEINPDAVVNIHQTFYTPETKDQFDFTQYDYVVDAIDTVTGKLALSCRPKPPVRRSSAAWARATRSMPPRWRWPISTKPRSARWPASCVPSCESAASST